MNSTKKKCDSPNKKTVAYSYAWLKEECKKAGVPYDTLVVQSFVSLAYDCSVAMKRCMKEYEPPFEEAVKKEYQRLDNERIGYMLSALDVAIATGDQPKQWDAWLRRKVRF